MSLDSADFVKIISTVDRTVALTSLQSLSDFIATLLPPGAGSYNDADADIRVALGIANHEAAVDPHPGYLTPAEGAAAYEALGAVATHAGLADPHPGYLTPAEGNAAYEVVGSVAAHVGLADPHTQYLKESDFNLSTFTTTNLTEGANLYYTDERVDDRVNGLFVAGMGIALTYSDVGNTFTVDSDIKQTEVDFGITPVATGTFTITDATVSAASNIIAQLAYVAPTDKDVDELEMDQLSIMCAPGSGSFDMFIQAVDGSYLADKFKINYHVG